MATLIENIERIKQNARTAHAEGRLVSGSWEGSRHTSTCCYLTASLDSPVPSVPRPDDPSVGQDTLSWVSEALGVPMMVVGAVAIVFDEASREGGIEVGLTAAEAVLDDCLRVVLSPAEPL